MTYIKHLTTHRFTRLTALLIIFAIALRWFYPWDTTPNINIAQRPALNSARAATEWYVSPTGEQTNSGSIDSPWDLTYALGGAGGSIQPGDTVWLRGGTYTGFFNTSVLEGTADAPIIIKQYHGEQATIDGHLQVGGEYLWLWGFEVTNSGTAGRSDTVRPIGLDARNNGKDVRFINMVIHDAYATGVGFWSAIDGGEMYGNIIYNNGYNGQDHGIYTQNRYGEKYYRENMTFNNTGYGVQAYGSGAAYLDNFNFEGNAAWNAGLLDGSGESDIFIGGGNPVVDAQVTENFTYSNWTTGNVGLRLGYSSGTNTSATVRNNYLGSNRPIQIQKPFDSLILQNNTIVGKNYGISVESYVDPPSTPNLSTFFGSTAAGDIDNNTYHALDDTPLYIHYNNTNYTLAQWQEKMGFDMNSTHTNGKPANSVFVRPNSYDSNMAHVIVYNWEGLDSVNVDLSSIMSVNDSYEIRAAQDYYGPLAAEGRYQGGNISLSMTGYDVSTPVNTAFSKPPSTFPEFGAFVVTRTPAIYHTITPTVTGQGSLSISSPTQVLGGDDLSITATPSQGWHIKEIKVDGISQGSVSSYTFSNVSSSHTIEAVFEQDSSSSNNDDNSNNNSGSPPKAGMTPPGTGTVSSSSLPSSSQSSSSSIPTTENTPPTTQTEAVTEAITKSVAPKGLVSNITEISSVISLPPAITNIASTVIDTLDPVIDTTAKAIDKIIPNTTLPKPLAQALALLARAILWKIIFLIRIPLYLMS
ncbi:MAG: hypothetical protein AAB360_02125 [Patescibacteria group bacterium]